MSLRRIIPLLTERRTPSLVVRSLSTRPHAPSTKPFPTPTTLAEHESNRTAAKLHRTALFRTKISNRTKNKTSDRRDPLVKDHVKNVFRSWYDPYAATQRYLDREAKRRGEGWRHRVAVMLERLPTITPDVEGWEEDYGMLRGEMDRYGKAWPKEFGFEDPMDREVMTREQLMDLLPEGFEPMPRETEADRSGFLRTLDRRLKTRVYLSTKPSSSGKWTLPTADLREDEGREETIVDCAKRALREVAGDGLVVKYIGNCPMGVTMDTYDDLEEREGNDGYFGVKTFYLRVQYDSGNVDEKRLGKKVEDWGWLDREEMTERVMEERGENVGKFYHYML